MNIVAVLSNIKKYGYCPCCHSNLIGGVEGSLFIGSSYFKRTCKCGFNVRIDNKSSIFMKLKPEAGYAL